MLSALVNLKEIRIANTMCSGEDFFLLLCLGARLLTNVETSSPNIASFLCVKGNISVLAPLLNLTVIDLNDTKCLGEKALFATFFIYVHEIRLFFSAVCVAPVDVHSSFLKSGNIASLMGLVKLKELDLDYSECTGSRSCRSTC